MDYLDHLIKHTKASGSKLWKLLLLDGHITHQFPDFVVKAYKHHIALHVFLSHLTHALQPLNVGVFRPWKHYHNRAIQRAVRAFDFEYTITSFFGDLATIREETIKPYTIKNAFSESGMWPVNAKAGIKKMRQYAKSTKSNKKDEHRADSPTALFTHPISWQTENQITKWIEQDPRTWSSPSREQHVKTLKLAKVQLSYAHLVDTDHQTIQTQLLEDQKRRTNSRKSLYKGGAISVADARKKRDNCDKKEHNDAVWKAQTAINRYVNKAKKNFKARGVQAHKDEKDCKKRLQKCLARGEEPLIGMNKPIHDPEKDPSDVDLEALQPHPSLVEALNALFSGPRPRVVLGRDGEEEVIEMKGGTQAGTRARVEEARLEPPVDEEEEEVEMVTEVVEEAPGQVDLEDSSGQETESNHEFIDSSDVASRSSDNLITWNADFILFE